MLHFSDLVVHAMRYLIVSIILSASVLAQIDPDHRANLTVYHLNPASAGAVPVNMDTGDVLGDLYFYLGEFLLPLECHDATSNASRAHFDCDNTERVDPNLVVTKVDMEVDSRSTKYSACNLCNGTDPFSHKPCEVGTYVCDCFSDDNSSEACDPKKLGIGNVTQQFVPHAPTRQCKRALQRLCGGVQHDMKACGACIDSDANWDELEIATCEDDDIYGFCPSPWQRCNATSPEWACWSENIARKTGGLWYSTLKEGHCNETSPNGSCTWKVRALKTIHAECLKGVLIATVESNGPECFQACGPRNTTSSCWISCFFDTVLGKDARHSTSKPLRGMPLDTLARGWTDAFLSKDEGGCVDVDVPKFATPPALEFVV